MGNLSNIVLSVVLIVSFLATGLNSYASEAQVFNTQERTSDLEGDLLASIYFTQNNVFPVNPDLGDTQQRLIANRSALLMVRPLVEGSEAISVAIRNADGKLLKSIELEQPNQLPKTVYYNEVRDFSENPGSVGYINNRTDINKLSDETGSFLSGMLDVHSVINISAADGKWVDRIYIPTNSAHEGRVVYVSSTAGYRSEIYFSSKSISISRGNSYKFKLIDGVWYREKSIENNSIVYAQNMWSASLPAKWIRPGNSLTFRQGSSVGELDNMNVGATTQLLLHTIDLGFLVEPRGKFYLGKDIAAQREYFQTVPSSSMIVSEYESLHLDEVMLANGDLLTDFEPTEGSVYNGQMRAIGKFLISHGINNANYGMNSSPGSSSGHPYTTAQLTAHHSQGRYSNGVIKHGLSGGNGMVTLLASYGNEVSHEVGHNYGLGHYPGGFEGSVHAPSNAVNSTWGWDADRMLFLPNFSESINNKSTCYKETCQLPFFGRPFGKDAMAGGKPMATEFSRFTLYTPYTAKIIQEFFESKAIFNKSSPTRFLKWNDETKEMEPYTNYVDYLDKITASIGDLTPAGFGSLFEKYDQVTVSLVNGKWTKNIITPAASASNIGRIIYINHKAGFSSVLSINGQTITVRQGFKRYYLSNGTAWEIVAENDILTAAKPSEFGRAVTTLVGFYDPENTLTSYVYPALHGAYGFTYEDNSGSVLDNDCQLQIVTDSGLLKFKLANNRYNADKMNKFHVNVLENTNPSSATVRCNSVQLAERDIEPVKSDLTYTLHESLGEIEPVLDEICIPIKAKNGNIAVVCL